MTMGVYQEMALVETRVDDAGIARVVDSFRITPSFGAVYYQTVDLGYPSVRTATQENPQANGTFNQTKYFGDRSVSVGLSIRQNAFGSRPQQYGWDSRIGWNSASWWTRLLSSWVTAGRRVSLYFRDDSGYAYWCPLVGNQAPSAVNRDSAHVREMLMNFTNPTGVIYGFDESANATADGRTIRRIRRFSEAIPGRSYSETYPKEYPLAIGNTWIDYKGSVPNGFICRLYVLGGTISAPTISVTAPDGSNTTVSLWPDFQMEAGTIVEFDTNAKTIVSYDADTPGTISDRDEFKYGPLTWPVLKPGKNPDDPWGRNHVDLSWTPVSGDASTTYLEIIYNDAYLL